MPRPLHTVRNTLGYAVPELFWGLTWALTVDGPMLAAFSDDYGGSQGFIGLAWFLACFGLGIPLLLSAFWVEPLRHKRAFVFWGHIAGGLAMLVVAALLAATPDPATARIGYLAGTTLFFVFLGLLIPAWLALVGELFSPSAQARVLGITFFANKLVAMVGGLFIARQVLASSWTAQDQWTLLFGIAGLAGLLGSFPFLWIVEAQRARPAATTLRSYIARLHLALRELPALRRFIAADAIGITVLLTLTFYADAAIRGEGFANARSGRWVFVGAVAQLITSGLIATFGARVRPRTWLVVGLLGGALAGLAAARGGSLHAYDLAAAALGVYMAARASCHAPQVMRLAPGRDGTAPIGVAIALIMPVQGIAPWLAGGVLIPTIGYAPVFMTAAGLGVLAAVLLLCWVPRNLVTTPVGHPRSAPED